MPKTSFEMSLDAKVLAERLAEMTADEIVPYEELSELIGSPVQGATGVLQTARRFVQREHGIVCECVSGVGLKRLTSAEMIGVGEKEKKRMRRSLRRALGKIDLAKDGELTREQKTEKYSFVALAGTVSHFLRPVSQKAIKEAVGDSSTISTGKILEAIKSAK